ncbi:MAG: hypothetical protein HFH82_07550 [Lachnospiraceae bacterium]|nr:hypothetical protein [Lachnospiraceae bacterium]
MKRLRKWTFLLIFLGTGLIYLSCVDHWQVYAKPLVQAKSWYDDLGVEEKLLAYADHVQTTGQPSFVDGNGETVNGDGQSVNGPGQENGVDDDTGIGNGTGTIGTDGVGDGVGSNTDNGVGTGDHEGDGIGQGTGNDSETGNSDVSQTGEPDEGGQGSAAEGENNGDSPENGPEEVAAPEYTQVEDDYFSDAVFIGDSRTMGLFEYGGLEEISTFYCSRGLTIFEMFDAELAVDNETKKKLSVEEALQQNTFSKVYLMLGINEMGGNFEPFVERYQEAVAHIQELQPEAVIYIQAIIKVTAERSAQGDYITNEGIEQRNEAISQMADNEQVFFLDVNPLVCDETGGMIASYTTDGVHLKAKYIDIWKDFLKSHAICLDE